MAKVNKMILGRISGTLGDITFRQRNGKNYLASRPSKFNTPQDSEAVGRRSKFSLSVKLASTINANPLLKSIWELRVPVGSTVYNYLVKQNYKTLNGDTINANTVIVPGLGFGITPTAITLEAAGISFAANPIGTNAGINTEVEKKVELICILCLSNPLDANMDKTFMVQLASEAQTLMLDANLSFTLALSNQETQLFNKYGVHKALFTIVTLDAENYVIHYADTYFKE